MEGLIGRLLPAGQLGQLRGVRSALLVVAHPDDESMFFAPSLHELRRQGASIHILCLSNGNGAGLGKLREKELVEAARVLQIPAANVTVVDDPELQDGMSTAWPAEAVARHVERHLRAHPCDAVLTFDARGVSGHTNHRGVHEGVRRLLESGGVALSVQQAWQLVSECLPLKYSAAVSVPLMAALLGPRQALVLGGDVRASVLAMAAHGSQWVWYRKLFVLLSSYTYANRLQRMRVA